jgi:hypothetical protein
MAMKHRTASGKILYYHHDKDGQRSEFGREWFSLTEHEDGQRVLRARCEIEGGVVEPRSVLREVTYSTDRDFKPIDCFNRLHSNGQFLGSGWMRFTDDMAECEVFSAKHGRMSQQVKLERPARSLGSHPVSCDMLHLPQFDRSRPEPIQRMDDVWMTSLEHDGCSAPQLAQLPLSVEYVGRETITVPAGQFDTDHYRILPSHAMVKEHPVEDLWCIPGSFLFVRVTVGGYMSASFDLVEFEDWN